MIEYHLPSKRKTQVPALTGAPWTTPSQIKKEAEDAGVDVQNTSFVFEKLRRDKIIKETFAKCKWKVGDFVMPFNEAERKNWGRQCRVTRIARNLIEFGEKDWPKNDCPMIVLAQIEGTNKSFYCTPDYLVAYEAEAAKT